MSGTDLTSADIAFSLTSCGLPFPFFLVFFFVDFYTLRRASPREKAPRKKHPPFLSFSLCLRVPNSSLVLPSLSYTPSLDRSRARWKIENETVSFFLVSEEGNEETRERGKEEEKSVLLFSSEDLGLLHCVCVSEDLLLPRGAEGAAILLHMRKAGTVCFDISPGLFSSLSHQVTVPPLSSFSSSVLSFLRLFSSFCRSSPSSFSGRLPSFRLRSCRLSPRTLGRLSSDPAAFSKTMASSSFASAAPASSFSKAAPLPLSTPWDSRFSEPLTRKPHAMPHTPSYYAKCMLGGILSCGLTHTAVTPLDVTKCKMQVYPDKYRGLLSGLKKVVSEEGVAGLRLGWAPTFLGYSMQGLFKFGLYEYFKDLYGNLLGEKVTAQQKGAVWLAASASAEFFADIALCPMEMVKVKMQTSPPGTWPSSFVPALSKMSQLKHETKFPVRRLKPRQKHPAP